MVFVSPAQVQASSPVIITDVSPETPQLIADEASRQQLTATDTYLLQSIAYCESHDQQFNASGTVYRGEVDPDDVGIFQLNEHYQQKTALSLGLDIEKTLDNIHYAVLLYRWRGVVSWTASKKCWSQTPPHW